MENIPRDKLKMVADSLDEFSDKQNKEYWRLLVGVLPRKLYTAVQIETFAEEVASPSGSPSIKLLEDLIARRFSFENFQEALEKIGCVEAQNVFRLTTVPIITEHPKSQTPITGGTLELTCKAHCKPPSPKYQWFHGNTPLSHGNRPTYKIKKAHVNHSGVYRCKVTNEAGNPISEYTTWSKEAKIEVLNHPVQVSEGSPPSVDIGVNDKRLRSPSEVSVTSVTSRSALHNDDIEILRQPESIECKYNETFELRCDARSRTGRPLSYNWISNKQGYNMEAFKEKILRLSSKRKDKLVLFCRVRYADEEGEEGSYVDSDKAHVTINSVWFTEQPRSIIGRVGEKAELRCKAEGKETIGYVWLKVDGKKKTPVGHNRILEFKSLNPNDWGTYVCQAENIEGFQSSVQVTVECSPSQHSGLRIISQPRSYVCSEGGSVTITSFKAMSSLAIHYEWYRKTSSGSESVDKQDVLIISPLTKEQCGTYYCKVRSGRDALTSHDFEILLGHKLDTSGGLNSTQISQRQAEFVFETLDHQLYAREKLALLIGNQKYEHEQISPLRSPRNDILKLKETLATMNFKVFAYSDLTFKETMKILEMFCKLAGHPGIDVVFYYSGHGFDFHNVDYIMPVDAQVPIDCDQCVSGDLITTWLKNTMGKVYVLLDCCRSIYGSNLVQPPAQQTTIDWCGYANYCKILSCSKSQPAYERLSEECSVFNEGLRKAFSEKTSAEQLNKKILEYSKEHAHSKRGREFQRSDCNMSLFPSHMTLHEPIMCDDWMQSLELTEQLYRKVHEPIPTTDIKESSTGNMVSGNITFNGILTNELMVKVRVRRAVACREIRVEIKEESNDTCLLNIDQVDSNDSDVFAFCISHLQRAVELKLGIYLYTVAANGEQQTHRIAIDQSINILPTDFL